MAPIPEYIVLELKALSEQQSGFIYTYTVPGKEPVHFTEAQVVADVLEFLHSQTQLVIGFAVKVGDLRGFLQDHSIEP